MRQHIASIAAAKGYRIILTMPETMRVERRNILKSYSAGIVLTKRTENKGNVIVALLPDSGTRYYSTPLFTD